MAAALSAVSGDQSRLWVDGTVIRLMPSSTPAVPSEITPAQAKIALSRAGKLSAVEAAIAAAGGETAIWWREALSFRRDHPAISAMGAAAGMTSSDVDALFVVASKIG
jgi:hypothetical protein